MHAVRDSLFRVLSEAIADMQEYGYDAKWRLDMWMERIAAAIQSSLPSSESLNEDLRQTLRAVFERATGSKKIFKLHRGVGRYTLEQVKPKLRAELDRRILASAQLIKLNREESIAKTLRRFSGWATSIPAGGSDVSSRLKVRKSLRKSLAGMPFEERRVVIDQGHKLSAAVSDIIATDGGAIATIWRSHWREIGYDYRPSHKARDGKVYLIRDSWAHREGYVKPAAHSYTDEITQPAEEPFCRCYVTYLYSLGELPTEMLTDRGRKKLESVRSQMAQFNQIGVAG